MDARNIIIIISINFFIGVLSTTGKILYECNISGCQNNTTTDTYINQEILVIQHFQQTVRAVEPHSGAEK